MKQRIVEGIFKSYMNFGSGAKQAYQKLKNTRPQDAPRFINSIFTEGTKGLKSGFVAGASALGLTGAANAATNINNNQSNYSKLRQVAKEAYEMTDPLGHILDAALMLLPAGSIGKIAKGAQAVQKSKGARAAVDFVVNQTVKARNNLVKAAPKAAEAIKTTKSKIQDGINKALGKATSNKYETITPEEFFNIPDYKMGTIDDIAEKAVDKGLGSLTEKEASSFLKVVKENAENLKALASEVGATKKEVPHLIKFANQFGDMLKNSPKYLRQAANAGKDGDINWGLIGNATFSAYDLWQEFKNGGYDLFPKIGNNAARMAAGMIPGGPITKLILGQLGYTASDKLGRAALRRLGFKNILSEVEQNEVKQGIRQPGISQDSNIPEYFTGMSGRRYHVVNDKVFAFDTGRPVNIQEAFRDADLLLQQNTAQATDRINQIEQEKLDLQSAINQGYDVNPEYIQQLDNEETQLLSQIRNNDGTIKALNIADDYNDDEDLVDQVYKKEVVPVQQNQQIQQINNQQQRERNYQDVYDLVSKDYIDNINNYFTPENLAIDYYKYGHLVARGQAQYMTPEQFANVMKQKALYEAQPQIRQQALNELSTLEQIGLNQTKVNIASATQQETARNNYVKNLIDQYKAQETQRHNLTAEGIQATNAQTNIREADIAAQNAQTRREYNQIQQQRANIAQQEANRRQSLTPYQQANLMGAGLSGATMGGLTPDQFINSNEAVMRQVYPAAFNEQSQPQQQQVQQPQGSSFFNSVTNALNNAANQFKR